MNHKSLVVLLTLSIFLSFDSYAQTPWEIDKSKDGIVVYTRVEQDSHFKSFKAVALVDATADEIIRHLKDADSYADWYGYTKTSKLLERETGVQYNYVETIFPWPYSNRDMVYRMSTDTSNAAVTKICLKGIPDYVPAKKGIVRMMKAEGHIVLRPMNGMTEVVYTFHSEPGDNVPVWLANNAIADLPLKTLRGLRSILKEENKVRR
ncbi:START domain-containing protein [Ekhidna sp. To15]|uniref:START domain-containing protein n=1 Tax=Ekhidna sp. To15 TaxID=3395267 RepID=UPI003F528977